MLQREKDAVVDYLEFGLVELIKKLEEHVHADAVAGMYKDAYTMLHDFSETTQVSVDCANTTHNKTQ